MHSQQVCGYLRGAINSLMGILGDLDRLEERAHVNLMKFNRAKCKVLHLGRGNTQCHQRLGDDWTKSSPAQDDLVMLLGEKSDVRQHWAPAILETNHSLGCINSCMASRLREAISPSTLLSEYPTQSTVSSCGSPSTQKTWIC